VPHQANLKRMREIMRQLDEVSQAAQELRERVERQMEAMHHRDTPAADDEDVVTARKKSRRDARR
jgi:hypothetical protein